MKKLKLTDLFPETGVFTLSGTGDHEHRLRRVSMEDRAWIAQNVGDEQAVEKAFATSDLHSLSRLVYHLLEDKTPFASEEREEWNEDGELLGTRKFGGVRKLRASIAGVADHIAVMKALLKTIGISEPILDDLQKDLTEAEAAEKKRSPKKSTGKKSSTK